ncbi:hypothetical protein ScPMuIL_005645 [Solemya velum]
MMINNETSADDKKEAEKSRQIRIRQASKHLDVEKNPCIMEQDFAFRCMDEHDYDREKCSRHFQNYKNCREFWSFVTRDRKRKGVKPYLPPADEREEVKKQYSKVMPWLK